MLEWFATVARDLPWRRTRDPYRIWLSEVMLQQTRVAQAQPYYERFVEKYPDVKALAEAKLDHVLRDWEGLGYYARARNMHRAAQMVVRERGGTFPTDRDEMLALPGVGDYTANAVLSIAEGLPLAVVDGNAVRVLSRLYESGADPRKSSGRRIIQDLANELIDRLDPGTFNEAIMELGATVCLPKSPECTSCPISTECAAYENGTIDRYPFRSKRNAVPTHLAAVAVIHDADGRVFIQRRSEKGLLGGLWEFPGGKLEPGETAREACVREVREELGIEISISKELPLVRHAYSHFRVAIHPFVAEAVSGDPETHLKSQWATRQELDSVAMPVASRKIIKLLDSLR
ncbi:MAG: A/G-specific adenine glycosylase [Rhodothermia bacterium]|nr:A/G-specific adenine glycosylase [Rhodothermia bacterium]